MGVKKDVKGFVIKDISDNNINADLPEKKLKFLSRPFDSLDTTTTRFQDDNLLTDEIRATFPSLKKKRAKTNLKQKNKISWDEVFNDNDIVNELPLSGEDANNNNNNNNGMINIKRETDEVDEAEEYLQQQLAKQRRILQSRSNENRHYSFIIGNTPESQVEELLNRTVMTKVKEEVMDDDDSSQVPVDGRQDLQITSTTEFCRTVLTPVEKLESMKSESLGNGTTTTTTFYRHTPKSGRLKKSEEASSSSSKLNDDEGRKSSRNEPDDDKMDLSDQQEEDDYEEEEQRNEEDTEKSDDETNVASAIIHQELTDNGIASALKLFQSRGDLTTDLTRRIRGSTDGDPLHKSADPKDVKLDYRDNYGRVMTPKEAFRYISWIFHGKKPGKKKQEKLLKKMEIEKKLKASDPSTVMPTMKALSKVQKKESQPFMVLTGQSEK